LLMCEEKRFSGNLIAWLQGNPAKLVLPIAVKLLDEEGKRRRHHV